MPVNIEVGDVVQVVHTAELGDTKALNVLYYKLTNVTDTVTGLPAAVAVDTAFVLPNLAKEMFDLFSAAWAPFGAISVNVIHTDVQKVFGPPRSQQYRYVPNAPINGLQLGESLPLQDSVTLLKKTGFGERWGIGRVFIVGVPESLQANGKLTAGGVGGLNPLKLHLSSNVQQIEDDYTYNFRPVLYTVSDTGTRITEIRSVELSDAVLKTQRRRRPGKGM